MPTIWPNPACLICCAKTAAPIGVSVVRAPGQIGRNPFLHRGAPSLQGASHRASRPRGHGLAPRETYFPQDFGVDRAIGHGADIRGVVGKSQFGVQRLRSLHKPNLGQLGSNGVPQHLVLGHGKAMPRWQGQHKVVAVISLHRVG